MQERPGDVYARQPVARWGLNALLFGFLLVLNAIIVWPLLIQDEFTPGEFKEGSFGVLRGETTLFLDDALLNELYPLIDLYANGQLAIPPGYSAAFPLRPTLEYRVRTITSTTAPYVVLGAAVPLSPSTRLDGQTKDVSRPPNPTYLTGAKVLSADSESRLELRPWDAARPWSVDSRWLSDLTSICGLPDGSAELYVRLHDDSVTLRLGRCGGRAALPPGEGGVPMMAVLTGPHATIVEKTPEPWSLRSRIVDSPVASLARVLLVTHAAVAALAVGLGRAAVVTGSLALGSFLLPFEAAVVWLLTGAIGVVVAFVRLLWRLGLGWGVILAAATVGALAAFVNWPPSGADGARPHLELGRGAVDVSKGPGRCLITGYSTVADATLHYGTPGIFELLDTSCEVCEGGTTRVAWRGGAFSQIRDTICADEGPIGAGQEIIFLGGANDDFQLPLQARNTADRIRTYFTAARIMFSLRELPKPFPAFDALQTLMFSVDVARRNVGPQSEAIRATVECANRRGASLWFFHDYLASDLVAGPSSGRAFLLAERRAAVESSSGRFVSLLEKTADRAGVSWFNDIVHLSSIGHSEIEQVICATLAGSAPAAAAARPRQASLK